MLVYLNAVTWTHAPEPFAADIREAMRMGCTCSRAMGHEFPSVLDPGRAALEFNELCLAFVDRLDDELDL